MRRNVRFLLLFAVLLLLPISAALANSAPEETVFLGGRLLETATEVLQVILAFVAKLLSGPVWLGVILELLLVEHVFPALLPQLLIAVGTEMVTAFFFDLRAWKVLVTNLVSSAILCLVLLIVQYYTDISFWVVLIMIKSIALVAEYLVYSRRLFCDTPKRKLLLFVCTANALSLAVGSVVWMLQVMTLPALGYMNL